MKSLGSFLVLLLIADLSVAKKDDWHFNPYVGFDTQYAFIKADSDSFNPVNGRFRIGSFFYKTVGIEFVYGGISMSDSTKYNVKVSLPESMTVNLRWESPAEANRGLSAYFLTGYVSNTLDIQNSQGYPGKQKYSGANLGLGLKQTYFNWLGVYCEYNYQYLKDKVRISGVALGMQIEF